MDAPWLSPVQVTVGVNIWIYIIVVFHNLRMAEMVLLSAIYEVVVSVIVVTGSIIVIQWVDTVVIINDKVSSNITLSWSQRCSVR